MDSGGRKEVKWTVIASWLMAAATATPQVDGAGYGKLSHKFVGTVGNIAFLCNVKAMVNLQLMFFKLESPPEWLDSRTEPAQCVNYGKWGFRLTRSSSGEVMLCRVVLS